MRDTKGIFIISIILHLLLFIILTRIIIPPADKSEGILDSLSADFVEIKPLVREEKPVKEEIKPTPILETKAKEENLPKPPETEYFSLSTEEIPASNARSISEIKTIPKDFTPKVDKGLISSQPVLKNIRHFDEKSVESLPQAYQSEGNIGGSGGFSGLQSGPIGTKADSRVFDNYGSYFVSTTSQRKPGDAFSELLPELARGIMERAKQKKMDVIFIIDTTGSMVDNVRGVKDYIHLFINPIEDKKFDVFLGLVDFTDLQFREAKVFAPTGDVKKFKKWLDKIVFIGGGDLPESGYEALITAVEKINYRKNAQRFFIFISDAPQHDFDYDGKSRYTLDRIINRMNEENITVDVIGANYLPMKQLAWGTGGQWQHIPGGDSLMDVPDLNSTRIRSHLKWSQQSGIVEDRVTIKFDEIVPDWIDISYKMLNPLGIKCLGTLTYRIKIEQKSDKIVEFNPTLDLTKLAEHSGIYTLIYRVTDNMGNVEILRRTLELRRMNS